MYQSPSFCLRWINLQGFELEPQISLVAQNFVHGSCDLRFMHNFKISTVYDAFVSTSCFLGQPA